MNKITCNICHNTYSSIYYLRKHTSNIHKLQESSSVIPIVKSVIPNVIPELQIIPFNEKNVYNCKKCNLNFSCRQNRWRHEQKCTIEINNKTIISLENKILELTDKLNSVMNKIELNNNSGTIITGSNNNINNNIVVKFGSEELDKILTKKEQLTILKSKYSALEESIKNVLCEIQNQYY